MNARKIVNNQLEKRNVLVFLSCSSHTASEFITLVKSLKMGPVVFMKQLYLAAVSFARKFGF